MKTIWKVDLRPRIAGGLEKGNCHPVSLPKGAIILSTAVQGDSICVWAEVESTAVTQSEHFDVFGTGDEIPPANRRFIGSVLMYGGKLVFHVYHRPEGNADVKEDA